MSERYIRPAHSADLLSLVAAFGDHRFFSDRLERQRKNLGVLFLAWLDCRLAGNVYLWLEEAEEPPIRRRLPGVALLTHLQVHEELHNLGIGSSLMRVVEQYLVEQGHERIALAVRTDNPGAARLYARLGYREWGYGEVICHAQRSLADGGLLEEPEQCHVLTKNLPRSSPSVPQPRTWKVGATWRVGTDR
ncbi:GNAT family N-acetyltransferase [Amycolatopsis sp. Hca4]|nr:GNAT family N-acetyltransferase [Amycolatopsis sp. Hca4]